MKHRILLLAGLVAALGAQTSWAQTATAPERPYYVGVGITVGSYQVSAANTSSVLAPGLVGGVYLSPRLALEAGLTIYHSHTDNSGSGMYQQLDPSGYFNYLPATFRSVHQQRTQALTLAARYTLLRPTERLRFDVLLGGAVVHTDEYGYNLTFDQATQAVVGGNYYTRYDLTGGSLLLGPSLRYQLSSRMQLAGEYVANFTLGNRVNRPSRLSGTLALSGRYCFGRQRAAAGSVGE
jgi:hypothetical protein